jgi:hypothetical protein
MMQLEGPDINPAPTFWATVQTFIFRSRLKRWHLAAGSILENVRMLFHL